MKVAIYSRGVENEQMKDMQQLFNDLTSNDIEPVFFQDFFNKFYSAVELDSRYSTFNSHEDLDSSIDCMISLGGDGTLLDAVTFVRDSGIPILGINYGRLGFLANIGKEEIHEAIKSIAERKYVLDRRSLVQLDANFPLFGKTPYALNEFTIHKKDNSSMIRINTYINGELLNTYWADGLIVSTPTGSTGYSLSCNGPVIFPDSHSFVITPVAPHNLNVRSIVIPDNVIVSFEVEGRTDSFICSMDSRHEIVGKEVQLAVRKANFDVQLIRMNENNFLIQIFSSYFILNLTHRIQ